MESRCLGRQGREGECFVRGNERSRFCACLCGAINGRHPFGVIQMTVPQANHPAQTRATGVLSEDGFLVSEKSPRRRTRMDAADFGSAFRIASWLETRLSSLTWPAWTEMIALPFSANFAPRLARAGARAIAVSGQRFVRCAPAHRAECGFYLRPRHPQTEAIRRSDTLASGRSTQ